jgi:hypothetical protein
LCGLMKIKERFEFQYRNGKVWYLSINKKQVPPHLMKFVAQ